MADERNEMTNGDPVLERMCAERHGNSNSEIKVLFEKVDTLDKKKTSKEVCEIHRVNMEAEMANVVDETKVTRNWVVVNILIVIAVGIFMTAMGNASQISQSSTIAETVRHTIIEIREHGIDSVIK